MVSCPVCGGSGDQKLSYAPVAKNCDYCNGWGMITWRRLKMYTTKSDLKYHGILCPKAPHTGEGYLHGEHDDRPYLVDGLEYCGRCHGSVE